MRLNGFKCDKCENIHNESSLPKGWIWLEQMIDSGKKYFHFCSLECLSNWASFQIQTPIPPFKMNKELANEIIEYVQQKGWNAQIAMREGLEGEKEWEQLRCVNSKDGRRFHVDTCTLRGMTKEGVFKFIDKRTKE